jgi:hypothetical protein
METLNKTENHFSGLFENRASKIGAVLVAFTLDIVNVVLAYGIIWFDRFGLDITQNLMNRLVTSLCWASMINIPIIQLCEIPRYFFGPQPAFFCFAQSVFKNAFKWQGLLLLDASIVARYVSIFWLKNPSAVNGGFWSMLINIWIAGVSLITNGVLFSMYVFPILTNSSILTKFSPEFDIFSL